ncbi:MAG TPA: hypothetical protein PK920_07780 [Phycisphaerae bacterium]|jgi:hypothetical protein|nr:hypothetical protein [Phycisphaerae bacterium]
MLVFASRIGPEELGLRSDLEGEETLAGRIGFGPAGYVGVVWVIGQEGVVDDRRGENREAALQECVRADVPASVKLAVAERRDCVAGCPELGFSSIAMAHYRELGVRVRNEGVGLDGPITAAYVTPR